ncbi:hypothetical protein DTO021D3_2734 [Paecilomyces variotii]|nr:hypothetical protein DTO032I3_8025 [Paecilomyces variotii]KAJ9248194.1 hypothetical protein DTO195F2_8922 [Paecilomyces variotii]KAJ9280514.1 hypothetical protein DTO021D3_2734 [Paecilomyces variotii]KAJ9345000.1 hypothetical protein DTO027B6_2145 [Paecilomyces variotii]KAJ9347956.1 hypothetical protein DTO027B9_8718 [Paecilomyces variotii]
MSHLTSNNAARGLLSTRSHGKERERDKEKEKEKDHDGDDGLLRPTATRESPRARGGSNSTGHLSSRKSSQYEDSDPGGVSRLRRRTITTEDLRREREMRKQGEEQLRSALFSISTFATEITRRLDYTYYNLLEKLTTLHAVMDSFHELTKSTALLGQDFEKETANLDQDTRRQLEEFKGFETQIRDIEALEKRMDAGHERVDALGQRVAAVKKQIEDWERKELEWQTQTARRLRIFWVVAGTAILVLMIAVAMQTRPHEGLGRLANGSTNGSFGRLIPEVDVNQMRLEDDASWTKRPSRLGHASTSPRPHPNLKSTEEAESKTSAPEMNPFRLLDEL